MARYLTVEKFRGAPPGRVVILRDDDMPSRLLIPLDDAAIAGLRRAKELYVQHVASARANRSLPGLSDFRREEMLRIPEIPTQLPPGAEPAVDLREPPKARRQRLCDRP